MQHLLQPNSQHAANETTESWNDERSITQLSSDAMTGLCHEIDVLVSLRILSIKTNSKLVLEEEWEQCTPQIFSLPHASCRRHLCNRHYLCTPQHCNIYVLPRD
mmetsp:Transcript_22188/g.39064  ORF Transcript_22188/g.39064 Transcript_22188/m.39064 type:complete len:104 (-) Transcript_22188:128-439(-)